MNGETPDGRNWYYYLDQAQGPYSWDEIEALIGAGDLTPDMLVARPGDADWRPAHEVGAEIERMAGRIPPPPRPAEPAEAWDERQIRPEPEGSGAPAAEVPAAPPQAAEWAYPSMEPAPEPEAEAETEETVPGDAMQPEFGIGKWISQGWDIVIGDLWPFVGATFLWMLIGQLSLGICGPPMLVGLFMMCLRRYNGERVGAGQVFEGFRYFLSSWGVSLLVGLVMLIGAGPMLLAFIIAETNGSVEEELLVFIGAVLGGAIMIVLSFMMWLVTFFSFALIADGRAGAWQAIAMSWEKVRENLWSFLGMILVFGLLANLGSSVCYLGWLVTYPLWPACTVAVYRYHFPSEPSLGAARESASN